jgi:hypothetical protein
MGDGNDYFGPRWVGSVFSTMSIFWLGVLVAALYILVKSIRYMNRYSRADWKADKEARKWVKKTLKEEKKQK